MSFAKLAAQLVGVGILMGITVVAATWTWEKAGLLPSKKEGES